VMGMLLDFFPLLIQRCAALLRVREKKQTRDSTSTY